MARVTVEDCLEKVENRFALVLLAAERAHQFEMGVSDAMISADNDKPTVVALREIAAGVDVAQLIETERGIKSTAHIGSHKASTTFMKDARPEDFE